ncbi:MAG TPA: hypothetical protein VFV50_05460 [Bdellovibrionales bacterium]|nr:hypothetical protein [Bdellovibrionales bacterium]
MKSLVVLAIFLFSASSFAQGPLGDLAYFKLKKVRDNASRNHTARVVQTCVITNLSKTEKVEISLSTYYPPPAPRIMPVKWTREVPNAAAVKALLQASVNGPIVGNPNYQSVNASSYVGYSGAYTLEAATHPIEVELISLSLGTMNGSRAAGPLIKFIDLNCPN